MFRYYSDSRNSTMFSEAPKLRLLVTLGGLIAVAAMLIACSDLQSPSYPVVEIPQEEKIPHYSADHVSVDTTSTLHAHETDLQEVRSLIEVAAGGLDSFDQLDVFFTGASDFHTYSLSSDRLIFLDTREYRLVEYDLSTDSYKRLAEHGQGPEDIQFASDMTMDGDTLRVATPLFELTNFDCSESPCEFVSLTNIDFAPISLSQRNDKIAVLGEEPLLEETSSYDDLRGEVDQEVIRLVDLAGETQHTFGDAYQSESWMARNHFLRDSQVQYIKESDQYVLIFSRLPYVYVYDGNFDFEYSFKIKDFIQYYAEHNTENESIFNPSGQERSSIRYIQPIDDQYVLLSVSTRAPGNSSLQYFLLDVANRKSYYLASQRKAPFVHYFLTEHGIIANDRGALHFKSFSTHE